MQLTKWNNQKKINLSVNVVSRTDLNWEWLLCNLLNYDKECRFCQPVKVAD